MLRRKEKKKMMKKKEYKKKKKKKLEGKGLRRQDKVEKVEFHRPIIMTNSGKARVFPESERQLVFRKQPVAVKRAEIK